MAGDWIKWCKGLVNRREVLFIASRLQRDKHEIAGRLMVFFEWLDDNFDERDIVDDESGDVSLSIGDNPLQIIDNILGLQGMAETMALPDVRWLSARTGGRCVFPNLARHNGTSAKQRASEQKKKQRQREREDKCPGTRETVVPMPPGQHRDQRESKSISYRNTRGSPEGEMPKPGHTASGDESFLTGFSPEFEAFWNICVRRTGKRDAFNAWLAAVEVIRARSDLTDEAAIAWLHSAYQEYANSKLCREWSSGGKDIRWTPTSFLNGGHYDDDREEWNRVTTGAVNARGAAARGGGKRGGAGGKAARSGAIEDLDSFIAGAFGETSPGDTFDNQSAGTGGASSSAVA